MAVRKLCATVCMRVRLRAAGRGSPAPDAGVFPAVGPARDARSQGSVEPGSVAFVAVAATRSGAGLRRLAILSAPARTRRADSFGL
jgi:hypothetical protein